MDHPCEKCGAAVEDGRPFCPQCRAPQIHVKIEIPEVETAATVNDAGEEPAAGISQVNDFGRPLATQPNQSDRGIAARAALKAGLLGLIIGMIPVLGIVLTGSLAVYFYRRKKGIAPSTAIGARLGGAAGIVLFAINAIFTIPIIALHLQQQSADKLAEIFQRFGINTATPQFQAGIQDLFTPFGLMKSFIIALVLASAGGALAAAIFRPRTRP